MKINKIGIVLGIVTIAVFLLFSCADTGNDGGDVASDGTVAVKISNAPDPNYLWAFAYEEDEWNIDMIDSVLSCQNGEITSGTAEIVLEEGCDASYQPTGGVWTATAGNTYDLYIYTTTDSDGNTTDKQATFPLKVTIDGDKTVNVDYTNMTNYLTEDGTLTVNVSGAGDHNGAELDIAVVASGDSSAPPHLAEGSSVISGGSATVTAQIYGGSGDWTGTGDTEYDVYIVIDVDNSGGAPNSGDYQIDPWPVTYYQDDDKVMNTVYSDDYVIVP